MNELERREDDAERVERSVRRALELVGPAERGIERIPEDDPLPAA